MGEEGIMVPPIHCSRRQFLHVAGGALVLIGTGALLSACGGTASATAGVGASAGGSTAGAATTPGGGGAAAGADVHLLIRNDIKTAYAADPAVAAYTKEFGTKVILDEPAAGDVTTKIQAAQASGSVIWDGFAVMEVPTATAVWVKRNLIQPLDGFIAASKVPDAAKVVPGIIPSILASTKVDGKQYAIPGNVGSIALAWLTEPLKAAGVTTGPQTWDEVYDVAKKVKAAAPNLTPFDSAGTPLCDLHAMIWSASATPITPEGLIDITGQASIEALKWLQKMVGEGLMPPVRSAVGAATNENFGNWQKGGTAMITSFDVAGTIAQKTFGNDKAATGVNMMKTKGQLMAGTPFWVNSCVVLNKAKNPQGVTDFFLWWFGPSNKETGKQITQVAAKPCYQYTYDEFVKGNADYAWELSGIEVVRNATPFQANLSNQIEREKAQPWIEKVLDPQQRMDPVAAMNSALADIKAEIAKQK